MRSTKRQPSAKSASSEDQRPGNCKDCDQQDMLESNPAIDEEDYAYHEEREATTSRLFQLIVDEPDKQKEKEHNLHIGVHIEAVDELTVGSIPYVKEGGQRPDSGTSREAPKYKQSQQSRHARENNRDEAKLPQFSQG